MTEDKKPPIPADEFRDEFIKMFMNMIDISSGMRQAKVDLTRSLLNQGVMINPQDMFATTDLILDRMQRICIIKALSPMLGLVGEQDTIMSRELDLIYSRPAPVQAPVPIIVNGENNR